MAGKRLAIIGGGFTGLAVGCYARMNGYEVDLFEQHTATGGLCTAWQRQGYTFDGCIHWLVGSDPATDLGRVWQEVGVLEKQTFVDPEIFSYCEGRNGERFRMYADPERLRTEMKRISPADEQLIDQFCNAIQTLRNRSGPRWLGMARMMSVFLRWGRQNLESFTRRLQNPFLARAMRAPWDLPDFAMMAPLFTLASLADCNAGYPLGGSLRLTGALERRARELGCSLHLGSRVEKILVESERAVGVRLASGEEHRADYVVGAGDLHTLLFDLLDGKYGREHQAYFDRLRIFEPVMIVSFGVKRVFDDVPKVSSSIELQLPTPVTLAGRERHSLHCRIFNFDPTLAPEGSTVVQVYLDPPYETWKELSRDRERYVAEKRGVADTVADALEGRFPGFKEQIEVTDVATPVTFERYTANWRGSFEGWLFTPKTVMMRMKRTLEGLDGLYLAGQWLKPGGGLPTAIMEGRGVVQQLCQRDGKGFVTAG